MVRILAGEPLLSSLTHYLPCYSAIPIAKAGVLGNKGNGFGGATCPCRLRAKSTAIHRR